MRKLLAVLVVASVLLGCQGSDPKKLTRDHAAELIKKAPTFQKVLRVNFYLEPNNPQNLIVRHFGYLEPDRPALTEAGRRTWTDQNMAVDEHSVLIAHVELVEMTGVSVSGNAADGQFTWQWVPNDAGKAMVIGSPEFQALPSDLQDKLRQPLRAATPAFSSGNYGLTFGGVRTGTANLQLFDDGWRVKNVYLL
jgi:hypothetical protein